MKLHDDGEFIALNWVKQALDATLARAREALETYVENPAELAPMRECVTHLHQVQGSLRMVELYGAAMVVENMERLAESVLGGQVRQREESYSVLMRGMVQLPDYLERLQSGHKDIPIVLLPLLNDLRACRGENLLTESALFMPDLALALPSAANGRTEPLAQAELRAQALRLRLAFQAALLKWFRDEGAAEHLNRLMDVLDRLRMISSGSDARRLWWIAAGTIEAVENGGLEASVAVKLLFGRVDREIHRFAREGEAGFAAAPPRELTKNLLYYVAHSGDAGAFPDGTRSAQIRSAYQLDTLLPSAGELQHAQGSMTGHNRNLLGTVSVAIKDDLLRVKEALDIFLRGNHADVGELASQVELLDRVGDTLGMLGLGVPRRVVGEQRDIIGEIAHLQRPVDEGALLDVAGALLYVEASLDDHIDRLGATDDASPAGDGALELPQAEVRRILDALMRESAVNIEQAKLDIVAFIESPWDHGRVGEIPRLLEEISGALRMLGLGDPAALMDGVARFVGVELIAHRRVPTAEQMDKLADALAAIEYYLEATRDQRRNRARILDVAREGLAALGYWPLPPAPNGLDPASASDAGVPPRESGAVDPPDTDGIRSTPTESVQERAEAAQPAEGWAVQDDHGLPTIDVLPGHDLHDLIVGDGETHEAHSHDLAGMRLAEDAVAIAAAPAWVEDASAPDDGALGGFERSSSDEIDDDIREVFIEEVEEEIENMQQQLPSWKHDVDDFEQLKPLRRSFHTLKGSGRLVGALGLGEFSWKVENLLNRVLDGSVPPRSPVVALVEHAVAAVPVLLAALRGDTSGRADIAGIKATADRLAAGEEAWLEDHAAAADDAPRSGAPVVGDFPVFSDDISSTGSLAGAEGSTATGHPFDAGPLPNVDPVLFDILQSEVAAHVAAIEDYLVRCEPQPVVASEALLRAAHTLNGAIAMVDIPAIGHVLGPLESYVKRLRAAAAAPSDEGIAALRDTVALTREVMQRLEARAAELPDSGALAARVCELRDSLPEADALLFWHDDRDGSVADALADDTDGVPPDAAAPAEEQPQPAATVPAADADLTLAWMQAGDHSVDEPPLADSPIPADLIASLAAFEGDKVPATAPPAIPDDVAGDAAIDEPEASIPWADPADVEPPAAATPDVAMPPADPAAAIDAAATDRFGAAAMSSHEPAEEAAPAARPPAPLAGAAPPPFAADPQPDGVLGLSDIDDDLLDIFVQEGTDILDHSDAMLAGLREAPRGRTAIVELQRDLHTLKGGARMAGLAPIGDLSHAMESVVDAVADGQLEADRAVVESLEQGFDRLHDLVQRVAQRRAIAAPLHAIARFEGLVGGEGLPAQQPTHSDLRDAAVPAKPGVDAVEPTVDAAAPVPAPRHLSAMTADETPHAAQEMIRVRSDLLDSLVNHAGEVSIYRSRLEEQISTFRFNLVEFDQTVSRLRDQLRKLEIETEAQIIARYQREQHDTGVEAFDPLELDRFSQLQQLSRALGESVSDLVSIQGLLDEQTRQSETLLLQQARVSSELQEGLMRTRMVPFESLVPNLRRTLRQAAQDIGKQAQLKVEGAHGEMDRNLLERMKAPFEHMLRNALAHGIERPDVRVAAGKPAEGTVSIAVSREATEVVLRVADDGRGMDRDAIRRQAIERGLLKAEVELSDRDLYGFVLESGFSTAEHLTQLSGRGVGMDVVHNEIKQLGGSLAIDSTPGKGVVFTIRLPFTLAVTQAILVKLGDNTYAIPMSSVQGVARIAGDDLERRIAEGDSTHLYAGEEYRIHDLAQLLGLPRGRAIDDTRIPLLMTRSGDQRAAIRIDSVVGSREIVVKSVGPQVSSVPGIFGATIMGDGAVVIILDLAPLVRRLVALRARIEAGSAEQPDYLVAMPEAAPETRQKPLVMVVDDSITMRKVTTRVLERADYEVLTAKDGLDALEKLQDSVPDLMLLDIEMPRMDGYELAIYMRNDARLRNVPIIMITSRTGEKHRQRALEIGVERYLGKPYQEDDLLRHVQEILVHGGG